MPFTEDELLPISALQHLLYCDRQCALIHLERAWAENRFTAEGAILHRRAHGGRGETRPAARTSRGLPVRGFALGLFGFTDVVRWGRGDDAGAVPVEYKRGRPKANDCDPRPALRAGALPGGDARPARPLRRDSSTAGSAARSPSSSRPTCAARRPRPPGDCTP